MVNVYYLWFNLETNQYLDEDQLLVKDYNKGLKFHSKESALNFMNTNEKEISRVGSDWTTREFFRTSLN